jgi:heterodisulfide reductase subunit C
VPIAAPAQPPLPAPPAAALTGLALFDSRHEALAEAQVMPEPTRCVQCGMCSYNCPMGIDVRAHAWRGLPVHDSHCVTCGECVKRCPRGVLRFDRITLFATKK